MEGVPEKQQVAKPKPAGEGNGGGGVIDTPMKSAEKADPWAKWVTLGVLGGSLLYCLIVAGLLEVSHNRPFQTAANFALFAAFIVVAGAIERFMEPILVALPPNEKKPDSKDDEAKKTKKTEENEAAKADRALIAYCIALIVGIAISSVFGLYFLETMGVQIGAPADASETAKWVFANDGERWLRGLDVFVTALIITGGTKPLHDMITSIEKKKDAVSKAAAV
ncbi:MAG TPA: hypothetical protein VMR96_06830 [Solirubrobacterales bacterium]|nr:hypothetical protein [Solirubrobacterales bacterium]